MELSLEEKRQFMDEGFIRLPGIVSPELVNQALWAINKSLGSKGLHPDHLTTYRDRTYCPELVTEPVILDLMYKSPLFGLLESLVGKGKVEVILPSQIALRFPNTYSPEGNYRPHLDGIGVPGREDTILSFTGIVGVFLSSLPRDYMSNLMVWPGTHRRYEQYFRSTGKAALGAGMPQIELPPVQQIKAEPGDAILLHYQLGHGIAANSSPHIRYAAYFRFTHKEHEADRWYHLTNMWDEWEGMQEAVLSENKGS